MRSDVFADDDGDGDPVQDSGPACRAEARGNQSAFARWAPARQPCSLSRAKAGGARRDRTDDLMLAKHALYQLSYGPIEPAQVSFIV